MDKKKRIVIAVVLMLSIINYSKIVGNENIRTIQFVSIFVIGALFMLLMVSTFTNFFDKNKEK